MTLTPAPRRPKQPSASQARWRVLVVDDNAHVRSAVARFLSQHDIHVELAGDGDVALDLVRNVPIDFVLLDVEMPKMNGLEVCRQIKAEPTGPLLPVFLLSALDSREDRIAGAEAGCDGYLGKPVDPGELIARVKTELKQRDKILMALRAAAAGGPPRA